MEEIVSRYRGKKKENDDLKKMFRQMIVKLKEENEDLETLARTNPRFKKKKSRIIIVLKS